MENIEFNWESNAGLRIFGQFWKPEGNNIKAVVCLVHGLGEHSSRYKVLPQTLTDNGFALIGFDLEGHGKSEGKRGHTPSYQAYMDNISILLDKAHQFFPGTDIFLYGHSLGGNLVINYILRNKPSVKGVIATGPWFRLSNPPKESVQKFAFWLNKFWPSFRAFNRIKSGHRGEERVCKMVKDRLIHPWISVRTFLSAQEAGCWAIRHAGELHVPLLILHGGEDQVTSVNASREFAGVAGEKCDIKIWPGLYHEIHNEPRNTELFDEVITWLNLRIDSGKKKPHSN
ncbi:MAG: lysophospholipase [Ignavibacteria bacterium]